MKKIVLIFLMSMIFFSSSHSLASTLNDPATVIPHLYDCSRKLSKIDFFGVFEQKNVMEASDFRPAPKSLSAYEASYLADNLLYILDRYKRTIYIFTPYFAGKADLSHDKDGHKIEVKEKYKLPDYNVPAYNNDSPTYRIRIPYFPDTAGRTNQKASTPDSLRFAGSFDISKLTPKMPGYFYLTIRDMTLSGSPLLPHVALITQFIPGNAQTKPDFSHGHGWVEIKEYHSLNIEDRLWNKNAENNFSSDAQDLLVAHIALRLQALRPLPAVGDTVAACPGLGCTTTYTKEAYEVDNQIRQAAIDSCKSAAGEFQLNLF